MKEVIRLDRIRRDFVVGDEVVHALRGISLTITEGEFVTIMGTSGSGKSTLLSLLMGFCRPDAGRILVDDIDLRDMDLKSYRSQIAVVPQNTILFSGTLRDNIAYAAPDATDEEILAVIDEIGLRDMVDRLPKGIYTNLVEHGGNFSGGQRQRIAIARALIRRPRLIIFDEATSALDPNTTQSILHLLKEINQTLGVTIVVITHEMRVIEQICKRVAVIDQSCIAEIGNVSDVFTHPKSDIAKALILPKSPAENLPPCTGKRLRLVFDGSCSNEPVISRITLECHVPVNILFADTRIVEGSIYGHMVIDLPDDPQQFHDVLRWLDHNHISYLQED